MSDKPELNTIRLSVPRQNQGFCCCLADKASPNRLNPNPVANSPPTANESHGIR